MKYLFNVLQKPVSGRLQPMRGIRAVFLMAILTILAVACSEPEQAVDQFRIDEVLGQAVFEQPDQAATAFAKALESFQGACHRNVIEKCSKT